MDHELKQRLIGAVVVTALAAIFIPMLFDDPVDTSGKTVKELTIPKAPADVVPETSKNLPADKAQVLNRQDIELEAREINEDGQANANVDAPATDAQDAGETGKSGVDDGANGSDADNSPNEVGDVGIPRGTGQAQGLGSDTSGIYGEAPPENTQDNTVTTTRAPKKPERSVETPTKKSVPKVVVSDMPNTKSTSPTENHKATDKPKNDATKKSSSKVVRYSIQAGSFNKKENAQALVEKLRKQGIPATLITKGEYFRVKIGPTLDKENAKKMKAKLDKQNIKGLLTSE
jgi:DedD protein